MFCKKCGEQIDDDAVICPKCGCPVSDSYHTVSNNDAPSGGFGFLCFLIPLLGLILYIVWNSTYPLKAKSCGKGAIIGVVTNVVIYIIALCCGVCASTHGY